MLGRCPGFANFVIFEFPDDLDDAVVNGQYVKSTFSNANGGCLSFTVAGELAAFIAGAKNGDFDHLLD